MQGSNRLLSHSINGGNVSKIDKHLCKELIVQRAEQLMLHFVRRAASQFLRLALHTIRPHFGTSIPVESATPVPITQAQINIH